MSASTSIFVDLGTVITNGPNAATQAKALISNGPINDYLGNLQSVKLHLQEVAVMVGLVKSVTASGDTANLALLNKLLAALNGTSTPSSLLITDISTVITNGPNATTTANASAPAGPIMDYLGMCASIKLHLQEVRNLFALLISVTDSTDSANLTLLTSLQTGIA